MDASPEQAVDPRDADAPLALIEDIQCKADGSFLVTCNGYPFHATAAETPAIHAQILGMLEAGEPSTDYHEPQPSLDDLKTSERLWRDAQIERVKWLRERHRDQQELQVATSLGHEQFNELLGYLQSLRDWPQSDGFPDNEQRPVAPAWLNEQIN